MRKFRQWNKNCQNFKMYHNAMPESLAIFVVNKNLKNKFALSFSLKFFGNATQKKNKKKK